MRDHVVAGFHSRFDAKPDVVIRSPGRVNLIGDHTDYNDGFVLPAAIEHATWIAARPRSDRRIRLVSLEHGPAELHLDALEPLRNWTDYVAGTVVEFAPDLAAGFDAVITTTIPVGAGLSSSAALELAIARLVAELGATPWDPIAAALAAQRAENEFVGVPCGIMDQLIVATAESGAASLIDCRSLDRTAVTVPPTATVVVLDTGTRRRLVGSAYEERRTACERVAAALDVPALRDATVAMLDGASVEPIDLTRARHVITENERTVAAADAFAHGDPAVFGRLMDESHASLRDDYAVSGPALDAMVDVARRHPACFGARMTGAGFAGCAVALVEREHVDDFVTATSTAYEHATGARPALYPTDPAAGVAVM